MKIHCESLDHEFDLTDHPQRVISLVSAATEALFAMGLGERVVGVSPYCARYVPGLSKTVAGDYLRIYEPSFSNLDPDLIVVTTGLQRNLGLQLAKRGFPVYALPLPTNFYGILENNVILGALMNDVEAGRKLSLQMESSASILRKRNVGTRPRVYVELWFGPHMRTIGGLTFIHDLVSLAGGDSIFGDRREGYFVPDLGEVAALGPDVVLFFSEEKYPVDFQELMAERGWDTSLRSQVIQSTVARGHNIIQEGPSFLDTAAWLQSQLH
jgi:ABC-type Fe3+-hydroxamate transport system substrate-binding protein